MNACTTGLLNEASDPEITDGRSRRTCSSSPRRRKTTALGHFQPHARVETRGRLSPYRADIGKLCPAGQRMTRAAAGGVGTEEINHPRHDPISGWLFPKSPGTKGVSPARNARSNRRRSGQPASGSSLSGADATSRSSISQSLRPCAAAGQRCLRRLGWVQDRATVTQRKTSRPVQFEGRARRSRPLGLRNPS